VPTALRVGCGRGLLSRLPFVDRWSRWFLAYVIWLAFIEWELRMSLRDWWQKVAIWFDPDRDWRSLDKIEHAFGGFAVALLLLLAVHSGLSILGWTMVIGLAYELGQADVAHSQRLLGKPGYGIGLVDLAYDGFGALVLLAFRFTLRLL
jgi:hypothetical protein